MVTMVPAALPIAHETAEVRGDGRPSPALRDELRRIASWRNAVSVVSLYVQTGVLIWLSARYVWTLPLTFLLMGRAFAQFASLMHEAAHRLLFRNKRANCNSPGSHPGYNLRLNECFVDHIHKMLPDVGSYFRV